MLGRLSAGPVDPELLHARFEGGGLHAEELGGSASTADPPAGLLEHQADVFPLDILERPDAGSSLVRGPVEDYSRALRLPPPMVAPTGVFTGPEGIA
jgi:hypothetical protein